MSDPFLQGLPRDVVMRLLCGKFEKADIKAYYNTPHFRELKVEAVALYGSCVLCGSKNRLTVHHRPQGYRALFREDLHLHVTVLCAGVCHRWYHHRGGK